MPEKKFWLNQFKIWTLVWLAAALAVPFGNGDSARLKEVFPKRANYFLSWEMTDEQARELAKWDLVILDMEHQVKNRDKILKMRELNPQIVILAYITVQEIRDDVEKLKFYVPLRRRLYQGIKDEWRLKRPDRRQVSWWPQTFTLNISDLSPRDVAGERWLDYLARFVSEDILASGLWDGMFFDNTWNHLIDKVGRDLDLDGDGLAESPAAIEKSYRAGMNDFFSQVRRRTGGRYLLVGNDGDSFISLDGVMLENFPYARGWPQMMKDYRVFSADGRFVVINANTANAGGRNDYRNMRFGLASALLGDGYFSFDLGDQNHGQTWWYDEYDFYLGAPAGRPVLAKNGGENFNQRGLWRRDFKEGLVLVNSGGREERADLGAEFEKLKGLQDPGTNDGVIVSEAVLPAGDGLVLLRPVSMLEGQAFRNGSFARIFNQHGQNIRNGFFAYDSGFRGGDGILIDELEPGRGPEIILAEGGLLQIYSQGELVSRFYPFGDDYRGTLSVAAADFNNDFRKEIVVGMGSRGSEVRIFDSAGRLLYKPFYSYPSWYKGGINLAAADLNANGQKEIVVGAANGRSQVRIFSKEGRLLSGGFYAYGYNFRGGVNVAAGDLDGDGRAEIVTGPTIGRPEIKIFDARAKQVGKGFLGASGKIRTGIGVAVADLDGDGIGEIVSLSQDVFTTALK